MAEPMDVDNETLRGTKRKADDLSIVAAPRRIRVCQPSLSKLNVNVLRHSILM